MSEKNPMENIAGQIIAQLKHGAAPWQKRYDVGYSLPFNPESGTVYHGLNQVILSAQGRGDPRWMTLKQANKAGYKVRSGAKSQKIAFWQYEKDGQPTERPALRYFSVFHASQLQQKNGQAIPAYEEAARSSDERHRRARAILENSGVKVATDQSFGRSYYDALKDEIHMPDFRDENKFLQSAMKGLIHATGHPDRLDRKSGPAGSPAFALEELRVQMASWMLSRELGLTFEPGPQETSKEWIKAMEADPFELSRAARDAEKIKEYVLGMEHIQEQAVEQAPVEVAPEPKPAAEKTFLAVPFKEKDEARELGAKWDGAAKLWYAPKGADMARLDKWLPGQEPVPAKTMDPVDEFAQALSQAGFKLNGPPIMDGEIHRVAVEGGKSGGRDGAYCGHLDGRPNGWMHNYKSGVKTKWLSTGHVLTEEQRTALKLEAAERAAAREAEREAAYKKAMAVAAKKFALAASADSNHPYLKAKGVTSFDLGQDAEGNLLIPAHNIQTGELQTIQTITPDGKKYFEAGCPKKGAMLILDSEGHLSQGDPDLRPEILVAEGYATAASLHEATGLPVAVAFDSGNLLPVAQRLKEQFPETAISICADNDHRQETNVGLIKAEEAAKAVLGRVYAPVFTNIEMGKGLTDFNDLAQSRGLTAVKEAILSRDKGQAMMNHTWQEIKQSAQAAGLAR